MATGSFGLPALPPASASSGSVDLIDLLRALWRRRGIMLVVFLGVVVVGLSTISRLPPRYTAEAALRLDISNQAPVDVDPAAGRMNRDAALIRSEMDVLTSRHLAARVVDELGLMADPAFNPYLLRNRPSLPERVGELGLLPQQVRDWLASDEPVDVSDEHVRTTVIGAVLDSLRVENDGESYTIRIYVEADAPELAAAAANAFASLYLVDNLQSKHEVADRAGLWIKGKLADLRQQVTEADQAVQAFREQHEMVAIQDSSLIDQQLMRLSADLAAASAERARKQSVLEASGSGQTGLVPHAAGSPLIRELRSERNLLQAELARLGVEFGPRHARIIESKSRLGEIEARIEQELQQTRADLETDAKLARANEQALATQLADLRSQREAVDRAAIELRQLTSEADAKRTLFDAFVEGYGRASAEVGAFEPDARILSKAIPPLYPSGPPTTLLGLLTIAGAAMLGMAAAGMRELTDRGYRDPADLERVLGIPVIGMIPLSDKRGSGAEHPSIEVVERPSSRFTEAVQAAGVRLGHRYANTHSQVALITSALPNEGKTAFALALGRFVACSGRRVLLIDCDLRRSTAAEDLGQQGSPGLLELVDGRATLDQVLRFDEPSGMAFLPASGRVAYPAEICSSQVLARLVNWARHEFDLIILDSPPVGIISDALVLTSISDATLLVVRWGKTSRVAVGDALAKLAGVGAAIAGVFSHVDPRRCGLYSYYPLQEASRYFTGSEDRTRSGVRSG